MAVATCGLLVAAPSVSAASTLVVPTQFPTVQAAVDAASAGDVIRIRPGTYSEQVSIGKNLTLVGGGARKTSIHAPATLHPQANGRANIVEITNGAVVRIRDLTVSGPGPTPCQPGSLVSGIRVIQGASLDLSSATVTHIHDTPKHDCNHQGTAINVGSFLDGEVGHARLHDVVISDYQNNGVGVFEPGSQAAISDSLIDAAVGPADVVFTGGVEVGDGAVARVTENTILGNRCSSPDLGCGPDPITQSQAAGINSGPGLPPGRGTEFAKNLISGNDVGIYLAFADNCCKVHQNRIRDNIFFGVAIQDETQTISEDEISGGRVGVGVIADAVDSLGILIEEEISKASTAPTQTLQCCGFTAKIKIK